MADKIAEYRRTEQMLRLMANQMRFPDSREQLLSLAIRFEKLADHVQARRGEAANAAYTRNAQIRDRRVARLCRSRTAPHRDHVDGRFSPRGPVGMIALSFTRAIQDRPLAALESYPLALPGDGRGGETSLSRS